VGSVCTLSKRKMTDRRMGAVWINGRFAVYAALLLIGQSVFAVDDAERLSRKVPHQLYSAKRGIGVLEKGDIRWGIPLWSCTPDSFKVIKVLGEHPAAPYAVEITVSPRERIYGGPDTIRVLRSIHVLALSLEDALKIRRALIAEIEPMRRFYEKQQGNPPGFIKRRVESQNR
jgi:hypothetical protein